MGNDIKIIKNRLNAKLVILFPLNGSVNMENNFNIEPMYILKYEG
jgi:hypothetical protein